MAHPVSRHTYRTPANFVTLLRILLTPFVLAAIYWYAPSWWVLLLAFAAMFTDRVDGWLARRYGTSNVGTFLDPLADKLIIIGAFMVLAAQGVVGWIPVILIAGREVVMSVWRSRFASQGISIPARNSGKYKVWVQSLAIGLALTPGVTERFSWVVTTAVWIAVAFTLVSLAQYYLDARRTGDPIARATTER